MSILKRKNQVVQTTSDKAYAEIVGEGRWAYRVRVWDPTGDRRGGRILCYARTFLSEKRAERYAKKRVARVQQIIDHRKYKKAVY